MGWYQRTMTAIKAGKTDEQILRREVRVDKVTLSVCRKAAEGKLSKGKSYQDMELLSMLADVLAREGETRRISGPKGHAWHKGGFDVQERIKQVKQNFERIGEARLKELGVNRNLPILDQWDDYQRLAENERERKRQQKRKERKKAQE